jgi:uncharacterized membrane protein
LIYLVDGAWAHHIFLMSCSSFGKNMKGTDMDARLFSWSFVLASLAFSFFLSYVTGSFFFLLLAIFPFAGKMLFGPRDPRAPEEVIARRRKRKMIFLIALAVGIGALIATLITQEAFRMAFASAAGIALLFGVYILMIVGAGRSIDSDHDDKYG